MAGIKVLRRLQGAREATSGTAVNTATFIWRGTGMGKDERIVTFTPEDVGYIMKPDRTYIAKLGASVALDPTPATYQQLPYVLEAGVKAINTGAADGSGSDKIYSYTFPTTSKNTINTYTLQFGDDQQAEVMEYSFVKSFKLDGKAGEALMVDAAWTGRQAQTTTFTSVTLPTVEEILFSKVKLYIDAVSSTYGTTQKTSTLLAATLNVTTGWIEVYTGDGNTYFTFAKITEPDITLDLTMEHDANVVTEKSNWRNQTARLVRLSFTGNAVQTAGTSYSTTTCNIDVAGKWETWDAISEQNGNDIVVGKLRARYDGTAADAGKIVVVNELAALT